MKRQIRRSVFETNSSSVHAIVIQRKNVDKEDLPDSVEFNHGEFGWEYRHYYGVSSKASYLYQAICEITYDDEKRRRTYIDNLYEILSKYGIDCSFDFDDYQWENCNGKKIKWANGYIDHGNELGDFVEDLMRNDKRLLRYLFGENSYVITGNDNSDSSAYIMREINDLKQHDYEFYEKWN